MPPPLAVVGANSNETANNVNKGKIVDAKGTIEKAPSAAQARRRWDLTDDDATRLEQEGVYIEVSQLTVPQQ